MYRLLCLTIVVLCLTSIVVAQVPSSSHVFVVVLENHGYSSVVGSSSMPYLNSLAQKYGLATQYYANAHSSITDYFVLTAGQVVDTADWTTSTYSDNNVVRQLVLAGKTWKSYAESLPYAGYTGGDVYPYGKNHNPLAYYTDVANDATQKMNLVPFTQFAADLNSGSLPNYSYIAPNEEHNAHDCPDGTTNCSDSTKLAAADSWLKTNIDPLINSPLFQQDGILVITFDEATGSDSTNGGGQVATVVVGPKVKPAFQSASFYQHESTLKMMMEALGLTSPIAATTLAPDMGDFFGPVITQPPVALSPPSVFFGYPKVGATTTSHIATLTNNQTVPLKISSIVASSNYSQTNNCPAQLAAGASCTLTMTFTPSTAVIQHGTVAISDDGPGSPHILYLAGTGTGTGSGNPAPTVTSITPNSGWTSGGSTVSIEGTGFFSGVAVSIGGSAATNVILNSSTEITATTGTHPAGLADVTVTNSDGQHSTLPGSYLYIVSGSGPQATLSPTSLVFGSQQVGTSSAAQTVTLTNSGGSSMNISTITASGDFLQTNNCGSALDPGLNCTILVSFTPSQAGTLTGAITITDSATGSPHTVSLSGTGTITPPCPAPSSPGVVVCAPVNGATVTSPVNFVAKATAASGEAISAMYVYVDDVIVYKGLNTNSLNVNVPATAGSHNIRTQVWDTSGALYKAGSNITVTTTTSAAAVTLNPGSLTFNSQQVSTTSPSQSVTLSNSGGSVLTLSGISASGDFAQTNNCGTSLNAGASCTIAVTFTPTQSGTRTGALTVTDSAAGSPHMVSLSGTGTTTTSTCNAPSAPGVVVCAPVDGASVTSPVNFVAKATAASGQTISAMYVYLDDVIVYRGLNTDSLNISVAASLGTHLIRTQVWDTGGALYKAGSNITVTTSGSAAAVSLTPSALTFGSQQVGTTSGGQTVMITNSGGSAMTLSSIVASGDFSQTNNCVSTLNPGASCNMTVTFTPTQTGTRSGAVTITDSAAGSPHSVSLSGTATTTSSCNAPSAAGVVVCAPLDGSTVTSPVNFVAKATPASGQAISAMFVYVDDVLVYQGFSNSLNISVTVASGAHNIRTQVWDTGGALYKAGANITVSP